MLFNTSVLKRLMKYAYKGWGLTVGLDAVRICPGPEPEQMAYVISEKKLDGEHFCRSLYRRKSRP